MEHELAAYYRLLAIAYRRYMRADQMLVRGSPFPGRVHSTVSVTGIARCTVERLMKVMGLQGVLWGKKVVTINPDAAQGSTLFTLVGLLRHQANGDSEPPTAFKLGFHLERSSDTRFWRSLQNKYTP